MPIVALSIPPRPAFLLYLKRLPITAEWRGLPWVMARGRRRIAYDFSSSRTLNVSDTAEEAAFIQPLVGDALLNLFARDPYDMTPADIAQMVAHYQRARRAGAFRDVAHKAIAAGKAPPRPRKSAANDLAAASGEVAGEVAKTRKPRQPRKRDA